jgi:hypothetical protein
VAIYGRKNNESGDKIIKMKRERERDSHSDDDGKRQNEEYDIFHFSVLEVRKKTMGRVEREKCLARLLGKPTSNWEEKVKLVDVFWL